MPHALWLLVGEREYMLDCRHMQGETTTSWSPSAVSSAMLHGWFSPVRASHSTRAGRLISAPWRHPAPRSFEPTSGAFAICDGDIGSHPSSSSTCGVGLIRSRAIARSVRLIGRDGIVEATGWARPAEAARSTRPRNTLNLASRRYSSGVLTPGEIGVRSCRHRRRS